MISEFTVFNKATGAIKFFGCYSAEQTIEDLNLDETDSAIAGAYDGDKYFIDITTMNPVLKEDYEIANIPAPCIIIYEESQYVFEDGPVEIEFESPGEHKFLVIPSSPKYLKKWMRVYVEDQI